MLRCLLALIVISLACFAKADFDEALTAYQNKEFPAAFAEFKRLAELGAHDAQFNLSAMYYRGEGVERDPVTAYAWMSVATEGKGSADAARKSAVEKIYNNFDSAQKELADKQRVELIANYGEAAQAAKLAPVLVGTGDDSQSTRIIKQTQPTYPDAMQHLGKSGVVDLIFGVGKDGITRDFGVLHFSEKEFVAGTVNALKSWQFEPAVVNGRPTEVYGKTIRFNYSIQGAKANEYKVLQVMNERREKAERGTAIDQYNYAYMLEVVPGFTGIKIDGSEANRWYYTSAASGNPNAQYALGTNLLYGKACTPDAAKSMRWLEQAAGQGLPDAQYLLAIEMLSGARLARNDSAAIAWLQKAADAKYTNAQLKLAWIYSTHTDKAIRNGSLAKAYVEKVSDDVFDKRTLYDVRAAVAAELGHFDEAIKWEEKARSELEKYKQPLASADEKLNAYKTHRAWVESL